MHLGVVLLKKRYCVVIGLGFGLCVALFSKHEPAKVVVDRAAENLRVQKVEDGGKRNYNDLQQRIADEKAGRKREPTATRWIINMTFSGCPAASDWFEMQDAVFKGSTTASLPSRCFQLTPGMIVLAPPPQKRATIYHNGHRYERGQLTDGTTFWTDSMDEVSTSSR